MMARTALLSRSCRQLECQRCLDGENGCCAHPCHRKYPARSVLCRKDMHRECMDTNVCMCSCHDTPAPLTDTAPSRLDVAIDALLNEFGFVPEARREAHDRIMQTLIETACNSNIERERVSINALVAAVRKAST